MAAGAYILELLRTDQDVVTVRKVHYPQERSPRHIAGKAADDVRIEFNGESISEAPAHERDPAVVGRDVGALAEIRESRDLGRKVIERTSRLALAKAGD
jgi:hypothetical protein